MEKTVKIENLTNRPRRFNLHHKDVCARIQKCLCTNGRPSSIFIPAHGTLEGLTFGVQYSDEVASASKRRPKPVIKVTVVEKSQDKAAKKETAPPPSKGEEQEEAKKSPPTGKDKSKGKGKKKGN